MVRFVLASILLVGLAACAKRETTVNHTAHGSHGHIAPHGGTLVELGEHAYNLEIVRDVATGKLVIYVLDGHAENFVRIKASSFELIAHVGADKRPLTLQATANAATGETVGDTAQFEAKADWLEAAANIDAVIPALEIRGTRFENISVRLPGAAR